ncbi:SDR family NAD(P)-dependent oxidoreductase [Nonomuraea sp. NPDC046570]|uniref:SDR family NAD(P)-dependent oxidoreductase n=1 Tax=Nonomuraea sp. NPDC046570 TaxID=3155255 RepID=UPI0033F2CA3D
MSTIAIVGAGPGLGRSLAKVFGGHGFDVALVARDRGRLDPLVAELAEAGITAAGFGADVTDRPSLVAAFDQIKERFGGVEVLEYSPAPHPPTPDPVMAGPLEVSVDNLQPQVEYYLYGAVTAARQVLPGMLAAGSGTLLFTTGGGSITPHPAMANVDAAAAALRNWVLNLHQVTTEKGVYAAYVAINASPPEAEPDAVAAAYWDLYTRREQAELVYGA